MRLEQDTKLSLAGFHSPRARLNDLQMPTLCILAREDPAREEADALGPEMVWGRVQSEPGKGVTPDHTVTVVLAHRAPQGRE